MERYRIVKDVALYYITFTVVEWLPVFIDETACRIVTDSLNYFIRNKFLGVNAYVILPTHLHAILFDIKFNSDRLKHTLDDMRKFTGRQLVADRGMPPNTCRRSIPLSVTICAYLLYESRNSLAPPVICLANQAGV